MGLTMTTLSVQLDTSAATRYSNYGFDSFCRGPDGRYYGIKADGLYLLEGEVEGEVDFGDLNFGTTGQKGLQTAYVSASSPEPLTLLVTDESGEYEYSARTSSETVDTHRFDTGRGLRANYFTLKLRGTGFAVDALEVAAILFSRRI